MIHYTAVQTKALQSLSMLIQSKWSHSFLKLHLYIQIAFGLSDKVFSDKSLQSFFTWGRSLKSSCNTKHINWHDKLHSCEVMLCGHVSLIIIVSIYVAFSYLGLILHFSWPSVTLFKCCISSTHHFLLIPFTLCLISWIITLLMSMFF